jgi:hypothetical protein
MNNKPDQAIMKIGECAKVECAKLISKSIKVAFSMMPEMFDASRLLMQKKITQKEFNARKEKYTKKVNSHPDVIKHQQCVVDKCNKQVVAFMKKRNVPAQEVTRERYIGELTKGLYGKAKPAKAKPAAAKK